MHSIDFWTFKVNASGDSCYSISLGCPAEYRTNRMFSYGPIMSIGSDNKLHRFLTSDLHIARLSRIHHIGFYVFADDTDVLLQGKAALFDILQGRLNMGFGWKGKRFFADYSTCLEKSLVQFDLDTNEDELQHEDAITTIVATKRSLTLEANDVLPF